MIIKKVHLGILMLTIISVVLASGCASNLKTYNQSINGTTVSFNYPSEYTINSTNNSINLNKTNTSIKIIFVNSNGTLDNLTKQFSQKQGVNVVSSENITINGKKATKIIVEYPNLNKKMEGVIIQISPGKYVNIGAITTSDNFEKEKTNFETIINSFK